MINDMPSSNHALNYNYSTDIALPKVGLNLATQDQPLMPILFKYSHFHLT